MATTGLRRQFSDRAPLSPELIAGSWYLRWGIEEQDAGYSYHEVVVPEISYDAIVTGVIRLAYTAPQEDALKSNYLLALGGGAGDRDEEFRAEWAAFCEHRAYAKQVASEFSYVYQ